MLLSNSAAIGTNDMPIVSFARQFVLCQSASLRRKVHQIVTLLESQNTECLETGKCWVVSFQGPQAHGLVVEVHAARYSISIRILIRDVMFGVQLHRCQHVEVDDTSGRHDSHWQ